MKARSLSLFSRKCSTCALHLFALHKLTNTNHKIHSLSAERTMSKVSKQAAALIDIDCNLLHKDLISVCGNDDPLEILRHPSTQNANIVGVLSPSSTLEESAISVELVRNLAESGNESIGGIQVLTTVGVHPYHAAEVAVDVENIERIKSLIKQGGAGVVCVGECGLDYSEGFPDAGDQLPWFHAQLNLAFELEMPLFLHERLSFKDFIQAIDEAQKRYPNSTFPPAVVHCFTGSKEECIEYVNRGFYIGLTGFLNKNQANGSTEIQDILRDGIIPLDKLMIETDAPYIGFPNCKNSFFDAEGEAFLSLPSKKRKKLIKSTYPNVPSSLPLVLSSVTNYLNEGRDARGESKLSEEELAMLCTTNSANFFSFQTE